MHQHKIYKKKVNILNVCIETFRALQPWLVFNGSISKAYALFIPSCRSVYRYKPPVMGLEEML